MKEQLHTLKTAVGVELQGLREGLSAARQLSLVAPQERALGRRFVHGLALPWIALGRALGDLELRRAYLRATLPVCLATAVLAGVAIGLPQTREYFFEHRAIDVSPSSTKVSRTHATAPDDAPDPADAESAADTDDEEEPAGPTRGQPLIPAPVRPPPPVTALPPPASSASRVPSFAKSTGDSKWLEGPGLPAKPSTWFERIAPIINWLGAIYAALVVVEGGLLVVTGAARDRLSLHISELVGAPPPLPTDLRVRRGFQAFRKRLYRRLRGLLALTVGGFGLGVVGVIPLVGNACSAALVGAWVLYWAAVSAIGTAEPAWQNPVPEPPFFMRFWTGVGRIPFVGWVARPYVAVVRITSRRVWSPCQQVERVPFEALGLGLSASICAIPIVRGFLQPILPVAAELVMVTKPEGPVITDGGGGSATLSGDPTAGGRLEA